MALIFFGSVVQGRASVISIWNPHTSQRYSIQLKHIVCGVGMGVGVRNLMNSLLVWSITEK